MRWLPALLLVLLLVMPLFIGGLSAVAVSTFVLDRGWYVGFLSDERLYDLPDAVSSATWHLSFAGLSGFPHAMGREALRELLPPAYLRDQASAIIDQVFTYLWGRGPLDVSVDLSPVKRSLAGDGAKRFALALAKGLPEASASTAVPKRGTIPDYRPKGWTVDQTARFIEASLPPVLASLPDRLELGDTVPLPWRGFSAFGMLIGAAVVMMLLACGAWLGSAFAFSDVPRERLLWLGGSLLAPALCVLAIGAAAAVSPLALSWARMGISFADFAEIGMGQGFTDAVLNAVRLSLGRVSTGFLATGGIAAGIGIGLLVWGGSTPSSDQKDEAAAA
ncbi:MAG: hypothetical protein NTU62_15495 [Spirochaetes bacterium]|nr:hypothetical protein [Spirochaetota bacterium]